MNSDRPPAAPYPIAAFPALVGDACRDILQYNKAPDAIIGMSLISAMAMTCQAGFDVETPVGQRAALAVTSGEESGAAVRVTDETAASGQRCLKLTDAPGLKYAWQPHLYYQPRLRKGIARLSFAVRLEEGAELIHEWRDASEPYRVGPSIRIRPGGRQTIGHRLLTLASARRKQPLRPRQGPPAGLPHAGFVRRLADDDDGSHKRAGIVRRERPLQNGLSQKRLEHLAGRAKTGGRTRGHDNRRNRVVSQRGQARRGPRIPIACANGAGPPRGTRRPPADQTEGPCRS